MLWKKKEKKALEPVDMQTGIGLLQKQIEAAKQMLDNRLVKPADYTAWNNRTEAYLIQIYGEGSPSIDTVFKASGDAPVWLFMPDDAAEKFEISRLENKIKLMEGCMVALKRKVGESEI